MLRESTYPPGIFSSRQLVSNFSPNISPELRDNSYQTNTAMEKYLKESTNRLTPCERLKRAFVRPNWRGFKKEKNSRGVIIGVTWVYNFYICLSSNLKSMLVVFADKNASLIGFHLPRGVKEKMFELLRTLPGSQATYIQCNQKYLTLWEFHGVYFCTNDGASHTNHDLFEMWKEKVDYLSGKGRVI